MQDKTSISLKRRVYARAALLSLLLLLVLGASLYAFQRQADSADATAGLHLAEHQALIIHQQLAFYRDILKRLAETTRVQELLALGDPDLAHAWSEQQRAILPHSVGLGLVDLDMDVLGTPSELRLGPACMADLKRGITGEQYPIPAVHREIPQLAHFDLVQAVADQDGALGLLLTTFSLDDLRHTLSPALQTGQHIRIIDGYGELILAAGDAPQADWHRLSVPIPESNWTLKFLWASHTNAALYVFIVSTGVLTSVLFFILFVAFSHNTLKIFSAELETIDNLLASARDGALPPKSQSSVQYQETAAMVGSIHALAQELKDNQQRLLECSLTDDLAQIPNRRHFNLELTYALGLASRDTRVCLALIDVDNFKAINDQLGHAAGDQVLQTLAKELRRHSRRADFVARIGGDEFGVILTNTPASGVHTFYAQLATDFKTAQEGGPCAKSGIECTLSCGAAFVDPDTDHEPADILRKADQALYRAKNKGRNCIEILDEPSTTSAHHTR